MVSRTVSLIGDGLLSAGRLLSLLQSENMANPLMMLGLGMGEGRGGGMHASFLPFWCRPEVSIGRVTHETLHLHQP